MGSPYDFFGARAHPATMPRDTDLDGIVAAAGFILGARPLLSADDVRGALRWRHRPPDALVQRFEPLQCAAASIRFAVCAALWHGAVHIELETLAVSVDWFPGGGH